MPFTAQERAQIETAFEVALAAYRSGLESYKASLQPPIPVGILLGIQSEISQLKIWGNIKAAVIDYAESEKDEEILLQKLLEEFTHADRIKISELAQKKEKAVAMLAEAVTSLVKSCGVKFTDPTQPYYLWGTLAGESQAQTESSGIGNDIKRSAAAVLPLLGVLPNEAMLSAAISKAYVDHIKENVLKAKEQGAPIPSICVYLPEFLDNTSDFWLWQLPIIRQLPDDVNITYKKFDPEKNIWENIRLADYKFPHDLLQKSVQQWQRHTADKDRERPLSVMLNVLQSKPKESQGSAGYHQAGEAAERDSRTLDDVAKNLEKIWDTSGRYHLDKVINVRRALLTAYYSQVEQMPEYEPWAFYYGKNKLDPEKIPTTLAGQLKLMQIAKQYHQYQLIIELYKQSPLRSKLFRSVQAKELVLWALNRRAEAAFREAEAGLGQSELRPHVIKAAANDLRMSVAIDKDIEKMLGASNKPHSKAALFERARRIDVLLSYGVRHGVAHGELQASLSDLLGICKEVLNTQSDPASGALYLMTLGKYYFDTGHLPEEYNLEELRTVAIRTYDTVLMTGLDECVEPTLLRAAFLAALTLNDPEKIAAVKKRMQEVQIHSTELGFMRRLYCCQFPASDDEVLKVIHLDSNQDFQEIRASQQLMKAGKKPASPKPQTPQEQFWKQSYDYRQSLATYYGGVVRGGNMRFGGVLSQQLVTSGDIAIFTRLLDTPISKLIPSRASLEAIIKRIPISNREAREFFEKAIKHFYEERKDLLDATLAAITDPEAVLNEMQYIVALNFQSVADDWDADKALYRELDYAMRAMNRLMAGQAGRKEHYDSTTSLSIMYGLQVGDCRHHGESMQLLFDTWKHRQLENVLNSDVVDQKRFDELTNTNLRVIDTLEERRQRDGTKAFTYTHTFNVLQRRQGDDFRHTVYDAFDLDLDPQDVELEIVDNELMFRATRIGRPDKEGEETRYKFTPYAGDKGAARATPGNLTLLGRSGITEESVYDTIVSAPEREKMQNAVARLAKTEEARERDEIGLDALYEMIILKGYDFGDVQDEVKPTSELEELVKKFLAARHYKFSVKTDDPQRLLKFCYEIQRRPDLCKQLIADALLSSPEWKRFEGEAKTKFGSSWNEFKTKVTSVITTDMPSDQKLQKLNALKRDEKFKSVLVGTRRQRFLNFILHVKAFFAAGIGEGRAERKREYRHAEQVKAGKFFRPDRSLLQAAKEYVRTYRPK